MVWRAEAKDLKEGKKEWLCCSSREAIAVFWQYTVQYEGKSTIKLKTALGPEQCKNERFFLTKIKKVSLPFANKIS